MLKCELCGNAIIKTDDDEFVCKGGCGCYYTKEQVLKLLGKSNSVPADDDFVIVAGVLKEYKGKSVNVVIPDGVVEIGYKAFFGMSSLQSVKFSSGVKIIQSDAFSECTSLKEITLKEGLEIIGERAFSKCQHLQTINLPNSLSVLQKSCFSDCKSLKNIDLPSNLKKIEENVFDNCGELTELIIPDSVESIGRVSPYSGTLSYTGIFFRGAGCNPNLTVRMPNRFNNQLVRGCKHLFDLSGNKMDTEEEKRIKRMIQAERERNHLCLVCGGEIGLFTKRCKKCGTPFGTV